MDADPDILCVQLQVNEANEVLAALEEVATNQSDNSSSDSRAALILWREELHRQLAVLSNFDAAIAIATDTAAQHLAPTDSSQERLAGPNENGTLLTANSTVDIEELDEISPEAAQVSENSGVSSDDGDVDEEEHGTIIREETPNEHGRKRSREVLSEAEEHQEEGLSKKLRLEGDQPEDLRKCCCCNRRTDQIETITAPCSHIFCKKCFVRLFKCAIVDQAFFPPRCCGERIPVEQARPYVSEEVLKTYDEKNEEWSTENPLYCSVPTCSTFIAPHLVEAGLGRCPKCESQTCTTCKSTAHEGSPCLEDATVQELRKVAQENKWQECSKCNNMVELKLGCNHITYNISSLNP